MLLSELMDEKRLNELVAAGYINARRHPSLPLRIFNYADPVHVLQERTPAAFEAFWANPEVCLCRGLIVDDEGLIVSRPQFKFFNLGQKSTILGARDFATGELRPKEVQADVVVDAELLYKCSKGWNSPLTITRKMDGMMGVLWNYADQWGIATRGSFESDGSKFATLKWEKFVKYGATEFVPAGYTLIFEIIAKHLRIVVPYEWEGLCLLTAVNNTTGEELPYDQLRQVWLDINQYSKTIDAGGNSVPGKPWCRLVEKFDIELETACADPSKEEEGYVAVVNRAGLPPVKSKVKLAEYCRLHKLLTNINPQAIWSELAYPMSPWIDNECRYDHVNKVNVPSMPVPNDFRAWVQGWQNGLNQAFHEKLVKALKASSDALTRSLWKSDPLKSDVERKKWLMSDNGGAVPKDIANAAMLLYHGKITEAYKALWDSVRPFGKDETFFVEGQGE